MSDSLRPSGLQHTRLLCPPPSPRVCSKSHPLSQWCFLTTSTSATCFSSCPQSLPASGSFPINWLLESGGQSIVASAIASVLLINIQSWFPLGLTDLIFLMFKGLSRVFSSTTVRRHQFFWHSAFFMVQFYIHTWLLKKHSFDYMDICWQMLFHMLSRFVIAFLRRSKCLLISWLLSPSTVILEP